MYEKVPMADEGLFYTQQIDFEPVEFVEEVSDTESFDEYLWMENEEEFEKTEMQRLEEEALMEECVEAMLEEEEQVRECLRLCSESISVSSLAAVAAAAAAASTIGTIDEEEEEDEESDETEEVETGDVDHLVLPAALLSTSTTSTLNPLAIEFIPSN